MVLGANDKNNGGYSIEDILEEVRRMRKEQTKKPGGVDRPKQSPNAQGSVSRDVSAAGKKELNNVSKPQTEDMLKKSGSAAGSKDKEIQNIHKLQKKLPQDKASEIESASKRPADGMMNTSAPKAPKTVPPHREDSKSSEPPKADNVKKETEPPKTGIRRLDRFLISGGGHSWDGSASNNIAPHALTPDELMKSSQGEQRNYAGIDNGRRNDSIIRKAALDGLINSDSDEISRKTKKDKRAENQKRKNISGQLPQNNAENINNTQDGFISERMSERPAGESGRKNLQTLRGNNFNTSDRSTTMIDNEQRLRGTNGHTQAFSIDGSSAGTSRYGAHAKSDVSPETRVIGDINPGARKVPSALHPSKRKIPAGGLDYGLPMTSDDNDYNTIGDAQHIRLGLDRKKSRLGLRAAITFILFCASALLSVFDFFGYPFDWITPNIYLLINIVLLAAAVIVNITDIVKVFKIFVLKATAASASALAVIAALANAIVLYFAGSAPAGGYQLFTAAAMLALFFTVMAEYINVSRVRSNFEIIANVDEKSAAFTMDDEYAQELAGDEELGGALVCGVKKTINIRGFLKNSFKDDPTDSVCNVLVPIILLISIVAALMMSVLDRTAASAITVFTSVITVSVPLSSSLLTAMQLSSASKKLREEYGTLAGYSAVEQYKDVNAVMMDSTDLFPSGSLHLHSIKNFGTVEVDKAILMAAAASVACGGTLADLFDSVIEGRHSILPKVDAIRYESGRGIVSTINGAEIKLGSREMMEHYSIPVPSAAAERKIKQRGAYALYLSVGKNLAAMFIVSYDIDDDIMYRLNELIHAGANLIIHTRDPLITSEMLGNSFKLPENCIRILDDETGKIYRAVSKPSSDFSSTIIGRGNIASLCHALVSCFKLHGNITFGKIAQLIAVIMAVVVALFVSFNYGVSSFGGIHLLIYQLACALIIIGGTSMRRT